MGNLSEKRSRWRQEAAFFVALAGVLALDQISKALVRAYLLPGESVPSQGWLRLTHVINTGASFGLFQGKTLALAITGAVGILALFLYYRYMGSQSLLIRVALGLQLGGALGNLADRWRLGYVTDFFDVGAWPVFNVADSALTVGIFTVIIYTFYREREQHLPPQSKGPPEKEGP